MTLAFSSGELLTAAKLNRSNPLRVNKNVTETLASSAALQDDNELFLDLAAGRTYNVTADVTALGATAGDIQIDWATTGTIALVGQRNCLGPGATLTTPTDTTMRASRATALNTAVSYGCAATAGYIRETFEVSCTVAGRLTMRWAQAVSNVTATEVIAGSRLTAHPVD